MRKRLLGLLSLALLLAPSASLAGEVTIQVGHSRLEPAKVSISAGDTVVFHNLDEMPGGHTIVADDGSFESPALAKDQSWKHTFEKPGSYAYHIKQHAATRGEVVVE